VQPRVLGLEHALRAGGERATQGIGRVACLPRGYEHRGGGTRAGQAIVGQREAGIELHCLLEGGHGAGVPAEAEVVLALQECLEGGPGAAGAGRELGGIGAGCLAQEGDKASREFIDDAEESVLTRRLSLHPPHLAVTGAMERGADPDAVARPDHGTTHQQTGTHRIRIGITAAGRIEIGERRCEYGAGIHRAEVTRTVERAAEQVDHSLAQVLEVTRATHDKGIDRKHVAGDR